jgi:hypothetical protein
MFAIPGTASQLSARAAMSGPVAAAPLLGTAGLFSDPHGMPQFTIALPTRLVAAPVDAREWASFGG